MFKMNIQGASLAKQLRALPQALTKPLVLDALKAGAEPMRSRMASGAPRGDEAPHIADNIVISMARKVGNVGGGQWQPADEGLYAVAVGPSQAFNYGLPWEYGWSSHPAAHPFARPAFDVTHAQSLAIIGATLWGAVASKKGSDTGGGLL